LRGRASRRARQNRKELASHASARHLRTRRLTRTCKPYDQVSRWSPGKFPFNGSFGAEEDEALHCQDTKLSLEPRCAQLPDWQDGKANNLVALNSFRNAEGSDIECVGTRVKRMANCRRRAVMEVGDRKLARRNARLSLVNRVLPA